MPLWLLLALLAAFAAPLAAQEADSLPPIPVDDYEEEEDEEDGPDLKEFLDAVMAEAEAARRMTPSQLAQGDSAPGVQAGGTEIRLRLEGTPETLVRDDADDPRDAPPPQIYGEEICPSGRVEGQFEPAQGTWQDDPTFVDKPGKQITRLSRNLYRAELKMVTRRWSLLHGIDRAVGGSESRRDEIFIKGEATGTAAVPVKFRFTLKQLGGVAILHESEVLGEIPIGGPCGPPTRFEVSLPAAEGIPPGGHFAFQDGEYLLEAELVTADGRGTGAKVGVLGHSVTTHAPSLAFRRVRLTDDGLVDRMGPNVDEDVHALAEESAIQIPDYFPLVNDVRLVTKVFPYRDRLELIDGLTRNRTLSELAENLGEELLRTFLGEAVREELVRELQVGALMSGFDRVVVLTSDEDFRLLRMGSPNLESDAVAMAPSQKLVFVNIDVAGDSYTVAHEIIHTLPFSFSSPQMLAECGLDYHGLAAERVANGHQVSFRGRLRSRRRDGSLHVMGASPTGASQWLTQCSYRHVLEVLANAVPDPRVLLVQGFVTRAGGRANGRFLPFYDLDGIEDLPADGHGSWAIVLRDAAGGVLARHPWEPAWEFPEMAQPRLLSAFAFRLLRPGGLARVELEGPDGLLHTRVLSATDPTVTIVSPDDGATVRRDGAGVAVEWTGADQDGDSLLYTVLYSSDGGQRWMDVVVETEATEARIPMDPDAPADGHRVVVRATDGGRSADATVAFRPEE